jgi:hypothetical protein
MSQPQDLEKTDRAADAILAELSDEEIRCAQKTMAALLRGVNDQRFKFRPELTQSVLVCSLVLGRHASRRVLRSFPAR